MLQPLLGLARLKGNIFLLYERKLVRTKYFSFNRNKFRSVESITVPKKKPIDSFINDLLLLQNGFKIMELSTFCPNCVRTASNSP